jgi:oxalate decarboxylase/phosphoglucose isomerase-like protein (cupin superfamily)
MTRRLLLTLAIAGMAFQARAVSKEVKLQTSETWNGDDIQYFDTRCPEVELVLVTLHPGEQTGVHLHPVNNYAYMVQGTIDLESGNVDASGAFLHDGRYKAASFSAGQGFAELVNVWHNGVNHTASDVQILVWYTTEAGYAVTVPWAAGVDYRPDKHLRDSSLCRPPLPPPPPVHKKP